MAAAAPPAFGRRSGGPAAAPRPGDRRPPAPRVELSEQAQAFLAMDRAAGRPDDLAPELARWKATRRAQMWSAAGPWKYWACVLGALSIAGRAHDFGPAVDMLSLVCRGLGGACAVIGFWKGFGGKR